MPSKNHLWRGVHFIYFIGVCDHLAWLNGHHGFRCLTLPLQGCVCQWRGNMSLFWGFDIRTWTCDFYCHTVDWLRLLKHFLAFLYRTLCIRLLHREIRIHCYGLRAEIIGCHYLPFRGYSHWLFPMKPS